MKTIEKRILLCSALFLMMLYLAACKDNISTSSKIMGGPFSAPYTISTVPTADEIGQFHASAVPYTESFIHSLYSNSVWNALSADSQHSVVRGRINPFIKT